MRPLKKSDWAFVFLLSPIIMTLVILGCSNNPPSSPPTPINYPIILTATPTPTNYGGYTSTPTWTVTPYYTPTSTLTPSLSAFTTIGSSSSFYTPAGIKYLSGTPELWMIDNGNRNLQEWTTLGVQGIVTTDYGSPLTYFSKPWGLCIDPVTSNIYVADANNNQIVVWDSSGSILRNVFGSSQFGTDDGAVGVGVNSSGTTVFALDQTADLIYSYSIGGVSTSPTYTYRSTYGSGMGLDEPQNLYVDSSNDIYIADSANHRILLMTSAGVSITSLTTSIFSNFTPTDMVVYGTNLYVVDKTNAQVEEFNSSGTLIGQFGKGILNHPSGITVDSSGNFYVTDEGSEAIYGFH